MRTSLILSGLFAIFMMVPTSVNAQTLEPLPPPPADFNPKAKTPPDLPKALDIPKNMRIEVKVWRKKPIHYPKPPDMNSLDILLDPDLNGAVIERGEEGIHATFNWQGDRITEVFVIHGLCFKCVSLNHPKAMVVSAGSMNFWLNRPDDSAAASDSFPGISWYAPSTFVGTASFNGTSVLVFTPEAPKPGADGYPEANSVCLDPKTHFPLYLDDGARLFTFTYTPNSNVQIDPQGFYLEMIKRHFGHYP